MAFRKNFRKKAFRRRAGFKRRRFPRSRLTRSTTLMVRGPRMSVIPDRLRMRFFFNDTLSPQRPTVAPGSVLATYFYNLNSLFNVDVLRVTQANIPYYGEMLGLYSFYRVYASAIEIEATNNVAAQPCVIAIAPVVTTPVTPSDATDYPYSRYKLMSGSGGMDRAHIKNYISVGKLLGDPKQAMSDDNLTAANGHNPATLLQWMVTLRNLTTTNVVANQVSTNCKITFYVEMYGRVPQTS